MENRYIFVIDARADFETPPIGSGDGELPVVPSKPVSAEVLPRIIEGSLATPRAERVG